MQKGLLSFLLLLSTVSLFAQPTYTANDSVAHYDGLFHYGANMGWYPPWQDTALADIAAGNPEKGIEGVGVKSFRPAIPAWYMKKWGYSSLLRPFQHYHQLGMREHAIFLDHPAPEQRDSSIYSTKWNEHSAFFKNLYLPIWKKDGNHLRINEENDYAKYVFETVKIYHPYVKFWEVWNEPDFEAGQVGNLKRGEPGNWWENTPTPDELPRTRAPLYHYIRMLRISYEVIKSIDPTAYVAIGGIGYESYLDAVLRNTDNPDQGKYTADYPLSGGAYFDVLSFHLYPQFEPAIRHKEYTFGFWEQTVYNRHSDAAAKTIKEKKERFEKVLDKYGYNGAQFPRKELIITEINVPRVAYGEDLGGATLQRNFIPKALIACQKYGISQMYIFGMADGHEGNGEQDGYATMGLYEALKGVQPYAHKIQDAGIAFRTTSHLLLGSRYDPLRTLHMQLPEDVDGGAFLHPDGNYTYVLWAKTMIDKSEEAHARYCFPKTWGLRKLDLYDWQSNKLDYKFSQGASCLPLSASPIFINPQISKDHFQYSLQLRAQELHLNLTDKDSVSLNIYDIKGNLIMNIPKTIFVDGGMKRITLGRKLKPNIYLIEVSGKRGITRSKLKVD